MRKDYKRRGKVSAIVGVCSCCQPFGGLKGAKRFSRRWVRRTYRLETE